jgi:hypothetical protein
VHGVANYASVAFLYKNLTKLASRDGNMGDIGEVLLHPPAMYQCTSVADMLLDIILPMCIFLLKRQLSFLMNLFKIMAHMY